MSYKSAINMKMKMDNSKVLVESEKVHVNLFDQLLGIDNETLKIVNDKIGEVKDQAENKISRIKVVAEAMQEKVNAYRQLDPKQHVLMEFKIEDIIKAIPKIKPNFSDVFHLIVQAYGEKNILPVVGKTFGIQLGADKGALLN